MKIRIYQFITIAVVLSVTVAMLYAAPRDVATNPKDQALTTTDGKKIMAKFDGKAGYTAPVRDGEYKLTNGGAIRVKAGKIVWDAFGVIEKLKSKGGSTEVPPALG